MEVLRPHVRSRLPGLRQGTPTQPTSQGRLQECPRSPPSAPPERENRLPAPPGAAGEDRASVRRWVAAMTAAAGTSAPAARSARAASARVAPVVMTSSTTITCAPSRSRLDRSAPVRFVVRSAAVRPAWSVTRRVCSRAWRQDAYGVSLGRRLLSRRRGRMVVPVASRVRSRVGSRPRRRTEAREDGTGTRTTGGPTPTDTAAADTARARAAPSGRVSAVRPRSLCATISCRTGPVYGATAHVGGRPRGVGEGRLRRAGAASRGSQAGHKRPVADPQPAHGWGSIRSSAAMRTPMASSLPDPRPRVPGPSTVCG
jgi:hypothetical protein